MLLDGSGHALFASSAAFASGFALERELFDGLLDITFGTGFDFHILLLVSVVAANQNNLSGFGMDQAPIVGATAAIITDGFIS